VECLHVVAAFAVKLSLWLIMPNVTLQP